MVLMSKVSSLGNCAKVINRQRQLFSIVMHVMNVLLKQAVAAEIIPRVEHIHCITIEFTKARIAKSDLTVSSNPGVSTKTTG